MRLAIFVFGNSGSQYGLWILPKLRLLVQLFRNSRMPGCMSMFLEHIELAHALLNVPSDLKGDVAEFGCYKGISTASLSLVCALTNRRLLVFDSFCGLPEPSEQITNMLSGKTIPYKKGDYLGNLEEVKRNVTIGGALHVCEFVPGYFSDTLSARRGDEKYVMVFEDADLPSSVRVTLEYVWLRLQPGCKFFTHEVRDREVVGIFFDDVWWKTKLGIPAPGLIGSRLGLPLSLEGSYIAYVRKDYSDRHERFIYV